MAVKNKKIGAAGRMGAGYGRLRIKFNSVESIQRKRQDCPWCGGRIKRKEKAIWECTKCDKVFASGVFHLKD